MIKLILDLMNMRTRRSFQPSSPLDTISPIHIISYDAAKNSILPYTGDYKSISTKKRIFKSQKWLNLFFSSFSFFLFARRFAYTMAIAVTKRHYS
jgi:hypothetical protein